jgi:hypothetical protein
VVPAAAIPIRGEAAWRRSTACGAGEAGLIIAFRLLPFDPLAV